MSNLRFFGRIRYLLVTLLLAIAVFPLILGLRPAGALGSTDNAARGRLADDGPRSLRSDERQQSDVDPAGAADGAVTLGLIDRLGGATGAVVVQGNLAYTAEGSQLTVLDISSPSAPAVVGKSPDLPGVIGDIVLAGNLAYVIAGGDLYILNVGDPAAPRVAGFYNLAAMGRELAVSGRYAYVASGAAGLQVLDISRATAVYEIGHYDAPSNYTGPPPVTSVAVAGSHAYIGADYMYILNITNPAAPVEVSAYGTCDNSDLHVSDIALRGHNAYLAGEATSEYSLPILCVVSVSDPTHPAEISAYYLHGSSSQHVSLSGNLAFAGSNPMVIFDISDPNWPQKQTTYATPGQVMEVVSQAGYAYVADMGGGLRVLDVSAPDAPFEVSSYQPAASIAYDVAAQGDYAYVAGGNALSTVHIAPTGMTAEGSLAGTAYGIAINGAYAALSEPYAMRVIDVSNPSVPIEVGRYEVEETGWISDLTLSGDFAYLAENGLRILNMSDPARPVAAGSYDGTGLARGVAVAGDIAYLAALSDGLHIVDVSDPLEPRKVSHLDTPGLAFAVAVAGDLAFVTEYTGGLVVVDVADPAAPVILSYVALADATWSAAAHGDWVYVANAGSGLLVFDVTDPTRPLQVGRYDTPGTAYSVAIDGNDVLVADREGGLLLLRHLTFQVHLPMTMAAGLD